ncbi:MAG: GatB/YqeY domain-containing protein [Thermaerobacter sp.]|nr:GatB/YqeY domain-containing protein [Thermaerobacter sp.]
MLRDQLDADLKRALRERHAVRLSVIRQVKAAVLAQETRHVRTTMDDQGIQAVIVKEIKERRDALAEFERAHREDLADKARAEISELSRYLPAALSPAELQALVDRAIEHVGATSARDLGAVMAKVLPETRGRADGRTVSDVVRDRLNRLGTE